MGCTENQAFSAARSCLEKAPWPRVAAGLILLGACVGLPCSLTAAAQAGPIQPNPDRPIILPEANRLPDANDQMEMRERQTKSQDFAAANIERRKQIADDSAKLLKLAADLKTEVDKTNKDTLSLNVIRKAEEIERLAHNVKEKMKLTVGGG